MLGTVSRYRIEDAQLRGPLKVNQISIHFLRLFVRMSKNFPKDYGSD